MKTLKQWSENSNIPFTHPTTELNAVSVTIGHEDIHRRELWELSDYKVSSVCGVVIWLVPTQSLLKDTLIAMYHFGANYHSGQASKGYRMLCQASQYLLREFNYAVSLDSRLSHRQIRIYRRLVARHWNNV